MRKFLSLLAFFIAVGAAHASDFRFRAASSASSSSGVQATDSPAVFNNAVVVGSTFTVAAGSSTFQGPIQVNGTAGVSGKLTASADALVGSTFTVAGGSSTFQGPVRMMKNGFVFGPGSAQASDAGDASAGSAYFQISRVGTNNMAIEMKQEATLRAEFAVNSSNHLSIQAIAGDVNINAAGGQSLRMRNNGVTQISVDTSLVTISTNTNFDGLMGLWSRTTAQLNGTTPTRAFQFVGNSDTGNVCRSTGATTGAWVVIDATTTVCD